MTTFDGKTYDPALDHLRLTTQLDRTMWVMADLQWHTLYEIQQRILAVYGELYSEAGISARLRDLRKPRNGSLNVERRRRTQGLWEYRVVP